MIFITGTAIAFFLELLLLSKRGKAKSDIILALWIFFIGLHLFLFYLQYAGLYSKFPMTIGLLFPLPLVHGPFLYLYVSTLTGQQPRRKILLLIHFIPPLFMYLYLLPFFFLPASEKIAVVRSGGGGHEVFSAINLALIIVSGITYVTWSQIILYRHRKNIEEQFSNIEKINLNWLRYLVGGMAIIWFVILCVSLIFSEFLKTNGLDADALIYTTVVLFVCFLGFFGLKQTNVFIASISLVPQIQEAQPFVHTEKYAKSGLKDADAERLHKNLNEYMKVGKPYLDSDLSSSKLAEQFDVHPNYLSQVINERERKNFYDFVNTYRIEEFKRTISDSQKKNLTILALALECGFKSKSAFNKCFKKMTGQTPSEYIKQIK
ncbi:MAG TPA: helix-turn-helix domain-containing protein [Candidatus Acidoferrales bacterium]|nr:helix-turn-helix domain-containing protein [Candidatus Acidoferrales bacterium]